MKIDRLFAGLNISGRGMSAQRTRMNVIAENIANAETTRTENGIPYRRRQVVFEATGSELPDPASRMPFLPLERTASDHLPARPVTSQGEPVFTSSVDGTIVDDPTPFRTVRDPGHPDADADGNVRMPNVNIVTEMVDMIAASRGFEANVTAINAAKAMAKDSLEI